MKITESQFTCMLNAYQYNVVAKVSPDAMRHALKVINVKVVPNPKTITINGITLPAPERTEPALNTLYYIADTSADSPRKWEWDDAPSDHQWLADGIVYLKKKHAEAARAAMLKPFIKK